jgi:pilus assembly protein CpaF
MTPHSSPVERSATVFLAACLEGGMDVLVIPADEDVRRHPRVAAGEVDVVVSRDDARRSRRIMRVVEVLGVEDDVVQLQELFNRDSEELVARGLRPRLLDRLQHQGITIDPLTFAPRRPMPRGG